MMKNPLWLRIAMLVALAAMAVLALRQPFRPLEIVDALEAFGADHPVLLPAVFLLVHLAASLMPVPRTALCVVAGLIFGLAGGIALSQLGAMAGAALGFVLARYINGNILVVENVPWLGRLIERAEAGGWRLVAWARVLPVVPHAAANYAFGLTRIGMRDYLAGSFIGMLPASVIYANLGASGRAALLGERGWIEPIAWGLGLVALSVIVTRWVGRRQARERMYEGR
jgi:uncharacterized membrane protein YdjX (TVP38/TMEM64 family)